MKLLLIESCNHVTIKLPVLYFRGRAVTNVGRICGPTPLNICICTVAIQYVYSKLEGATEYVCYCLFVIMWFLFGEVSSSSVCLGWATLFDCGIP